MPRLNFDYTQFLKKQNALYTLKYQDDPIVAPENPQHIIGYHGHRPNYRSSIHKQRAIKSLVRCLTSPMKPTTAAGFITADNKLPEMETPRTPAAPPKLTSRSSGRAHTAPVIKEDPPLPPSRISMMSAGSSESLHSSRRAKTTRRSIRPSRSGISPAPPKPGSAAPSVTFEPVEQPVRRRHPEGHPLTNYGASYWYAWPDETKELGPRPKSYLKDRSFDRSNNVIYHKHEGVVPKYLGYVPGYKFRHGATYGVLTVNATSSGATHRQLIA